MLTCKTLTSAQATNYFVKGYLVEENSRWYGKGAAKLSLVGEIDNETVFANVVMGYSPDGRRKLSEKELPQEKRRAGVDCTLSAPKSVSMTALVAGDDRLFQARQIAVEKTLAVIEERYAQTRVREGNDRNIVKTGNLVVAQFDHIETRELDFHLHTHCLIMNLTELKRGKWYSHHNDAIFENKKFLGTLYQHYLAIEVQKLGYEIEDKGKGQFEIKGYQTKDLEHFSKRRQQILELVGKDSLWTDREKAWNNCRKKKQVVHPDDLKANWFEEAKLLGIQFVQPSSSPKLPDSSEECSFENYNSLNDAIAHCSERNVAFKKEALETFILSEHRPVDLATLDNAIAAHPELIALPSEKGMYYTTQTAVLRELSTIKLMQEGKDTVQAILNSKILQEQLATISLTQGQKEAVTTALTTTDQVIAWQGVAGAGKTYALNHFSQLSQNQGYLIKGFAPSAEAAKVLGNSLNINKSGQPSKKLINSGTHGLSEQGCLDLSSFFPRDEVGIEANTVASLLCSKPPETIEPNQIWIVDEAGLLSAASAHQLLERAKDEKARIIFVGDTRQLSAVEAGNPFKTLQSAGMTTAYMDQSLRQRVEHLQLAVDAIARGEINTGFEILDRNGCIQLTTDDQDKAKTIVSDYIALSPDERAKTLIVAGTNQERLEITAQIREKLIEEGSLTNSNEVTKLKAKNLTTIQMKYAHHLAINDVVMPTKDYKRRGLEKGKFYTIIAKDEDSITSRNSEGFEVTTGLGFEKAIYTQNQIEIAKGDRLKWIKNDRSLERRNGQEFRVTQVEGMRATIAYDDGKSEILDLTQPLHLDHALVTTTYSSQGKTADRVLISADYTIAQESLYVAVSRSKYNLKLYTTDKEELLKCAKQSKAKENPLELVRAAARNGERLTQPVKEDKISVSSPEKKVVAETQEIKPQQPSILRVPVAFAPLVEQSIVSKNPLELLTQNYEPRNETDQPSAPVNRDRETARKSGKSNQSASVTAYHTDSGNLERLHEAINRNAIAGVIVRFRGVVEGINRINQQLHDGIKSNIDLARAIENLNEQFNHRDQKTKRCSRDESPNTEQKLVEAIKQRQIAQSLKNPLAQLSQVVQGLETVKIPALDTDQIQILEQTFKQIEQAKRKSAEGSSTYAQGQQQVDFLFSLCVEYIDAHDDWILGNYQFSFDSQTLVLTCQNQSNPSEFLRAVGTEDGWEYQEGLLAELNEEDLFELLQELLEPEDELER
ncbi:relaxase [Aphanothece hegewaldii CCALA 016]|uniref:Relaxase n=1 Tax=Aphanothece hegewaldii CCALA 016 TaxID=2107694 RepID=A0A2T1LVM2_9CHRO|nr:MobF family relaxase [Aphanothece hegewaldii]PSF35773.1 relaxase [Aphanothece hegewaldii CCALA 016]